MNGTQLQNLPKWRKSTLEVFRLCLELFLRFSGSIRYTYVWTLTIAAVTIWLNITSIQVECGSASERYWRRIHANSAVYYLHRVRVRAAEFLRIWQPVETVTLRIYS